MSVGSSWKKWIVAVSVLVPGMALAATVSLSGTTYSARPELGGSIIADTSRTITCNGVNIGTLQDRVVQETGGTLDFYRKVDVSASGWTVQRVKDSQRTWLLGGVPDADYRIDSSGTTGPNSLVYENAGSGFYTLDFQFGTNLSTSNNSKFFFGASTSTGYSTASNILSVWARYGGVDYVCPISSSYRSN